LVDKSKKNFIIVDGSSYLYRAYYALPHLKNSQGQNTGAIFGVTNMLLKLLKTYNPQHLCIVFDAKGKNFRHVLYKEYKSNRKSMPTELSEQVQPIMDFIRSLGIKILQISDVEADDVIATLAYNQRSNIEVIISSGDKDLAQLVTKNVILINSMDDKILDTDGIHKKFGVYPKQIFDYLVLIGDTSDNIPGVEGIGPKTAVKLLDDFENLEGIFKNIDNLFYQSKYDIKKIKSLYSNLDTVSFWSIDNEIKLLAERGYSTREMEAKFQRSLAFPFFLLSMLLLSAVFTLGMDFKENYMAYIFIAIILSVLIYFFNDFSAVLGKTEKLPIKVSVWMPITIIFIFSSVGIIHANQK